MGESYIDPSREDFARLKSLPLDHPVEMLNLVKLRDKAKYADGRDASGTDAYAA